MIIFALRIRSLVFMILLTMPFPYVAGGIDVQQYDSAAAILLDRIAIGEGTTDAAAQEYGLANAYDITYAYGMYNPNDSKPLTEMTIGEVKRLQKQMLANQANSKLPSSAVGKYQLISTTLVEQQNTLGLSDDTPFDAATQELFGLSLLEKRGYKAWTEGRISDYQFQKNMAKEWASVADPDTGKSYYGQHVGTTDAQIKETMALAKSLLYISQQEKDQDITLTLYIHDGSTSGPIIPGAQVTGWDGLSNSYEQTSSSSGYVTITGFPGIWSFSASADGYETNSWSQEITATDTKDAFLQKSTGQPSATGFDPEYPIGVPRILGGTGYVTETSTGWHNAQDWSEYNPDYSGYHPGEDWNYGSGTDDFGEPVYAIAAGTVFDTRDALFNDKSGYGSGIAIEHMLPNSERIYSLYEHIDITAGLSIGDSVSQADRIGSIADTSKLSPHLHFEIRTKQVDTDDWYPNDNGYGYYDSIESLYADGLTINPSDFIDSHRHVAPEESEPKPEASNPPIVQTFNVTPLSVDFGESFEVDYTVSDNSRSGLKQVELWRKDEESDWQQISAKTLAGEIGSISGSLTDSPSAPGKYWYGVHVVDNADNWNDQKNSNTNGQPSSFEPIEVEVKAASREIDQISEAHELQRFKHNVDVSSMAFSPDGAKLATIDGFSDYNYSGIARIWDVATGAELQRMNLEDKMRSVIRSVFSKVIFSPDGKKIGTAGTTTVQIWDVATGAELQRMNCGQEVVSAAFSPDFTKVATANDDYRVRIWDVATGAELIELNPYTPETIAYYEVKTVVFSPDGSKVAVCHGGTVQIWDVSSGAEIQKIKDAGESVLLFSPDGSKVATTTSNPFANKFYARIWDVTNGAELQRLNHEAPVGSIDFQQEGNKIVTECSSTALIWDVATGAELKMLDHSSPVQFVSFSRDGSKLATTSYWNDTVRIWDATTGAEIQKLPQKSDHLSNPSPTSILFSLDGSKMAVSVSDETVRIWDITA